MQLMATTPLRLLTHNIRYATKSPFKGEELWSIRKPRLINELFYHTLHNQESFICLQEVLHAQLVDILSSLNSRPSILPNADPSNKDEWAYIGVGRNDGKTVGEYSPIIYRCAVWSVEKWKTIWLSETPSVPSKGWDAASTRLLTIGQFRHCRSGKRLIAMNTHLDDQGSRSRLEAAKLILQEALLWSSAHSIPVFLAGDLNSEATQEAYMCLNGESSIIKDVRNLVKAHERYGHELTYTGFGYENEPQTRIDYLFLGPKDRIYAEDVRSGETSFEPCWRATSYAVLENRFDDNVYISDHRAVVTDVNLL